MSIIGDIGSVAGGAASLINSLGARKQMQQQFEQQKQLYSQQFEQQKQMIAEQNSYNSPANQRRLLEEAGLNPNLMYQNGSSQSIQSEVANPQVVQAPLVPSTGQAIAGGISQGIQTMMSMAQLRLLESQVRKNDAETEGQNISNRYTPQQFEQQLRKGEVDIEYTSTMIDKAIQDINESNSRIGLNREQIASLTQGISESQIRAKKYELEAKGIEANTELVKQKIATEMLEQGLFAFREALMAAQTHEAGARSVNIRSQTFEQDWKNAFIQNTGIHPSGNQWQIALHALKQYSDRFDRNVVIGSNLLKKGANFVGRAAKGLFNEVKRTQAPFLE